MSTFRLLVKPAKSAALPVTSVNMIEPGQKLRYEPVRIATEMKNKAKVAVLLVPESGDTDGHLRILVEKPANAPAEWDVPIRASVVGVVFGEHGVDEKRVNSLVEKNPELIPDLADYAERTSTVQALVETLSKYEQSAPGSGNSLQSVLHGFSAQYGTSLPTMDAKTPADQQAAELMRAIVPAFSPSTDPASHSVAMQSAGLASSVGSLFLGTPVTLAIGGAALLDNVHGALFPATDFRPAFTQSSGSDAMELCTASQQKKAHTRLAYLWMLRVPDAPAPSVSLAGTPNLPIGWQSTVKVSAASIAQLKLLPRARQWHLVSSTGSINIPVTVAVAEANDTVNLDLRKASLAPGEYKLAANWDWSPLAVAGTIHLHPFADFSAVTLTPESEDRVITLSGTVTVQLTGADFEFVNNAALADPAKPKAPPVQLSFELPEGEQGGEQRTLSLDIDTTSLRPGPYSLLLKQLNGKVQRVPLTVNPANPKLGDLPLHANVGESEQTVSLHGQAVGRIERITSPNATWTLAPFVKDSHDLAERQATIRLDPQAHKGDLIPASVFVVGLHAPLQVPNVIQVLGPRPKIMNAKASFSSPAAIELHEGEIPAGGAVSFALQVDNIDTRPSLELTCSTERDIKQTLTLSAGQKAGLSTLDMAGDGMLFLSLDPGSVGQSGCNLSAKVRTATAGVSDAFPLGRVIDLPHIDKFELTNDKVGDSLYAGILTGKNLQMIEKTGWNSEAGYAVQGIPTPIPGVVGEQTLRIVVPWPSPSPRAPLYVWLRGETAARLTQATF